MVRQRRPSAYELRLRRSALIQAVVQCCRAPAEAIGMHLPVTLGATAGSVRAMRVAYLLTQYPKVSHTFIRREIRELERRGHDVSRITIRPPEATVVDELDIEEESRTICVLAQPVFTLLLSLLRTVARSPYRSLRAFVKAMQAAWTSSRGWVRHGAYLIEACFVLELLERDGISHLHVHFGTNAADVAQLVAILGNRSYSMTVHGPTEFDDPAGYRLADKVSKSAFTIAISSFTAGQLLRWTDLDAVSRIHVVRCCVDRAFLRGFAPPDTSSRDLVFVGRLTRQKAPLLLVEAFAEAALPKAHLVLAGDGELRPVLERRIRELGLERRVEITGWLSEKEVRERILASRAVVLPSFAEGLPVVLMEAFALGRPVISTYVAGIPELVENGRSGWLVPSGDAGALSEAMQLALGASTEELRAMATAARASIEARHFVEEEVGKLESLLATYALNAEVLR